MSLKSCLLRTISEDNLDSFSSHIPIDTKISELQLPSGHNLLHDLAISQRPILHYYLRLINALPASLLKSLLNSKSEEIDNYTPLQLAILYHKKWRAMAFLESGADPTVVDSQGRSCLHLATRGNNVVLFMKFLEKGLDINLTDGSGNTSLHLAISGRYTELALIIISLTKDLSVQGSYMKTPLHLAVEFGNYRVVRRLLAKGANRLILNDEGKSVLQMETNEDIEKLLHAKKICGKTQYEPNSFYFCVLAFVLTMKFVMLLTVGINSKNSNSSIFDTTKVALFTIVTLIFALCMFFFVVSAYKDPGFVASTKNSLSDLYANNYPENICIECRINKVYATYHCVICRHCVSSYDHHCKWINNCVGSGNIKYFSAFLIFTISDAFIGFMVGLEELKNLAKVEAQTIILQTISVVLSGSILIIISPIMYLQLTNQINSTTSSIRFSRKSVSRNQSEYQENYIYFNE